MPLFTVTTTFSTEVYADDAPRAEEFVRHAFELPPNADIQAEGPVDPLGGDKIED